MEQLKAAIEHTHERVESQAAVVDPHGHQLNEQTAMNVHISEDLADAKGESVRAPVLANTGEVAPGVLNRVAHAFPGSVLQSRPLAQRLAKVLGLP